MTDQTHPLTLYNSLTRTKEQFKPIDPKRVTMYNCGPTVYSYAHIGNARAAVVADVLFRVLRHIYGENHVFYARNITDVDDKIIAAAKEQGVPISDITEKYARIYNEDLAAIGCLPPTYQPLATENIQEMADIIVTLINKDIAYASEGHVFFDVSKHKEYGQLSGNSLDQLQKGNRVGEAEYARKRNAADFVLWKPATRGDVGWKNADYFKEEHIVDALNTEDPKWRDYSNEPVYFETGRPGWHIECSAMIRKVLGDTIDIHCGGIDLKFPHHENEIAQSECANDQPLANFWVHNEFLNMGSEKMSKSVGNVKLIRDLLKDWDGEVIRLALLKAHYRSELVWSEGLLRESKENLDSAYRYKSAAMNLSSLNSGVLFGFDISLFQDLGVLEAFKDLVFFSGSVSQTANKISRGADIEWDEAKTLDEYLNSWNLLGLLQKDPEDWFKGGASADEEAQFDAIAKRRETARAEKNWPDADAARDEAKALGIVLEDGPDGTTWRRA